MEKNSEKQPCNPLREAYLKVPRGKIAEFRERAKDIFGVTSDQAFWGRIRNGNEPRVSQGKALEELFKEYGVELNWHCAETEA